MQMYFREEAVVCGTEELEQFCAFHGAGWWCIPSGQMALKNQGYYDEGKAESLHRLWKTGQNILEYASAIATHTNRMVQKARRINGM